jgi:microcystin-dependent protein
MPYSVNHTNGEVFTNVADQVVNNTSSLSFIGKNYTGYGKIMAENFLHLLENFANTSEPLNPVEGQIWYDNTSTVQALKVYDGTKWNPAGSIKKAASAPLVGDSINGDLWVNPNTNQLFMFSGNTWDLIGPQFSSGLKTGPVVDIIDDILNETHAVLSLYSTNERIAVFSSDSFTPKILINGFEKIKRGINLSTNNITTDVNKIWGTAESADSLIVNGNIISSSNFLRSDVSSVTNKSLSVQTVDGISIGSNLDFKLSTDDTTGLINLTSKNSRNFKVEFIDPITKVSNPGLFIDSQIKIGVGTVTPSETFDVNGSAVIRHNLTVGVTTGTPVIGNISANGNLTILQTASIGGASTFSDTISVYKSTGGSVFIPKYTPAQIAQGQPLYDIGSSALPFRDVYATTIHGNITGNITGNIIGNVSGSATTLSTVRAFKLEGDVTCDPISFNGTADVKFLTTVSPNLISTKTAATSTLDTDLILTYRPTAGLQKTSKQLFLSTVPSVPPGAIFPYAGINPPNGYLFCDGSEVLISIYPELYTILGNTYRNKASLVGEGTFALPDLRGRFPLGRDNMDNNMTISTASGTLVNAGGNRNGTGNPSSNPANRVHHSSGITLGAGSGNEALGSVAVNGVSGINASPLSVGNASAIMNPYQTINYIIFTGILQ